MKRLLSFLTLVVMLLSNIGLAYAEETNISKVSLGATLNEEEKSKTLNLLGANETVKDDILTIDGKKVDQYLKDGSDDKTDVYSSAYVELKPEGYGVQVQIATPENITDVSTTMYQNEAITAGARNVLIKIASVQKVTGEGALTGLYETFEVSGFGLDDAAISFAEKQVLLEQKLVEITKLSAEEVSRLVLKINLFVVEELEQENELNEKNVKEFIKQLTEEESIDLSDEAIKLLVDHTIEYSKTPAVNDPNTKNVIAASLSNSIVGKEYVSGDIKVSIDDIYFTDKRDDWQEKYDHVLTLEYTLENQSEEEYHGGQDFDVYVDGHKAEDYFASWDKINSVSGGRTTKIRTTYGFNGEVNKVELELKDYRQAELKPTIIETGEIRNQGNNQKKERPQEEASDDQNGELDVEADLKIKKAKQDTLEEPGEYIKEPTLGTLTLIKIAQPEETKEIVPGLELTLHTLKLIKLTEISKNEADFVGSVLGIHDEGYYLQVVYSVNNKTNESFSNVMFDQVVYSNNEQKSQSVLLGNTAIDLMPNAKASDQAALILAPNGKVRGGELFMSHVLTGDNLLGGESGAIQFNFD